MIKHTSKTKPAIWGIGFLLPVIAFSPVAYPQNNGGLDISKAVIIENSVSDGSPKVIEKSDSLAGSDWEMVPLDSGGRHIVRVDDFDSAFFRQTDLKVETLKTHTISPSFESSIFQTTYEVNELSVNGDYCVVSYLIYDVNNNFSYDVRILTNINGRWEETLDLHNLNDGNPEFGSSVDNWGNKIVVSSWVNQSEGDQEKDIVKTLGVNSEGNQIVNVRDLVLPQPNSCNDLSIFEKWIAISGDFPDDNYNGNPESVLLYYDNGVFWDDPSKVISPFSNPEGPSPFARFGRNIHLNEDFLIVAAPAVSLNDISILGTAIIYERAGYEWLYNRDIIGSIQRNTFQRTGESQVFISDHMAGASSSYEDVFLFEKVAPTAWDIGLVERLPLPEKSGEQQIDYGSKFAFNKNWLFTSYRGGLLFFYMQNETWHFVGQIIKEGYSVKSVDCDEKSVAIGFASDKPNISPEIIIADLL